jgi:hypothetical protein
LRCDTPDVAIEKMLMHRDLRQSILLTQAKSRDPKVRRAGRNIDVGSYEEHVQD